MENKFNDDCARFIEFVKHFVGSSDDLCVLYLERSGNTIIYGKCEQGIRIKKDTIKMVSGEDLRNIYNLVQTEFASNIKEVFKNTFGSRWTLSPIVGGNVMIKIESDNDFDLNWFFEEMHVGIRKR